LRVAATSVGVAPAVAQLLHLSAVIGEAVRGQRHFVERAFERLGIHKLQSIGFR
jgi:hypothetical protein